MSIKIPGERGELGEEGSGGGERGGEGDGLILSRGGVLCDANPGGRIGGV